MVVCLICWILSKLIDQMISNMFSLKGLLWTFLLWKFHWAMPNSLCITFIWSNNHLHCKHKNSVVLSWLSLFDLLLFLNCLSYRCRSRLKVQWKKVPSSDQDCQFIVCNKKKNRFWTEFDSWNKLLIYKMYRGSPNINSFWRFLKNKWRWWRWWWW